MSAYEQGKEFERGRIAARANQETDVFSSLIPALLAVAFCGVLALAFVIGCQYFSWVKPQLDRWQEIQKQKRR